MSRVYDTPSNGDEFEDLYFGFLEGSIPMTEEDKLVVFDEECYNRSIEEVIKHSEKDEHMGSVRTGQEVAIAAGYLSNIINCGVIAPTAVRKHTSMMKLAGDEISGHDLHSHGNCERPDQGKATDERSTSTMEQCTRGVQANVSRLGGYVGEYNRRICLIMFVILVLGILWSFSNSRILHFNISYGNYPNGTFVESCRSTEINVYHKQMKDSWQKNLVETPIGTSLEIICLIIVTGNAISKYRSWRRSSRRRSIGINTDRIILKDAQTSVYVLPVIKVSMKTQTPIIKIKDASTESMIKDIEYYKCEC